MEEEDLIVEQDPSAEKCSRCLAFVPGNARRCPHCGQPVSRASKIVPLMIWVAAFIGVVFLFVMIYRVVYVPDASEETTVEDTVPDGGFAPPPETSAGHEPPPPEKDEKPPEPAAPEKKPPLNR